MVKIRTRNGSVKVNGNSNIVVGRSLVVNGKKIIVDGVEQPFDDEFSEINIVIEGDVERVEGDFDTLTANTVGAISTQSGDVHCGDVAGSVSTMSGDVRCGDIGGSVSTMSGDIRKC